MEIKGLGTARLLRSSRLARVTLQFNKQSKPPTTRSKCFLIRMQLFFLELCFTQPADFFYFILFYLKTGSLSIALAGLELDV